MPVKLFSYQIVFYMLKIRLSRTGKRNDVSFRIVVTEHTKPVKSGFIEHIGFYNPESKQFQIDKDKLDTWMKKGATLSTTVNNLLVREKIFAKDKVIKITRVPKKKEEEKSDKPKKEEAPLRSASSAGSTASPAAKSVEKTEAKNEEVKEEAKTEAKSEDKKPEEPKAENKQKEAKTEEKKPEVDKK